MFVAPELRGPDIEFGRLVEQSPFRQPSRCRLERARFNHVASDSEERLVDPTDHIGAREDKVVIAAFQRLAAEIFRREVMALEVGSHRAVVDKDAIGKSCEISGTRGTVRGAA